MSNNYLDHLDALKANLFLLATDFESLKSYLIGYSEEGIYSECIEGVREQMATFSSIILSQQLSSPLIAKIFDCYYLMESLVRSPLTNTTAAFKASEHWQKVKQLALEAAKAIEESL